MRMKFFLLVISFLTLITNTFKAFAADSENSLPNQTDEPSKSFLMFAYGKIQLENKFLAAASAGNAPRINALLTEYELPRVSTETILFPAVKSGSPEVVTSLVEAGANVDAFINTDEGKETPIHHAIHYGNDEITIYLIRKSKELRSFKNGMSLLEAAMRKSSAEVIEALIERLDLQTMSHDFKILIGICRLGTRSHPISPIRFRRILNLLHQRGMDFNVNALPFASICADISSLAHFRELIALPFIELNLLSTFSMDSVRSGDSIVHVIASDDFPELLELIIDKINPDLLTRANSEGKTPGNYAGPRVLMKLAELGVHPPTGSYDDLRLRFYQSQPHLWKLPIAAGALGGALAGVKTMVWNPYRANQERLARADEKRKEDLAEGLKRTSSLHPDPESMARERQLNRRCRIEKRTRYLEGQEGRVGAIAGMNEQLWDSDETTEALPTPGTKNRHSRPSIFSWLYSFSNTSSSEATSPSDSETSSQSTEQEQKQNDTKKKRSPYRVTYESQFAEQFHQLQPEQQRFILERSEGYRERPRQINDYLREYRSPRGLRVYFAIIKNTKIFLFIGTKQSNDQTQDIMASNRVINQYLNQEKRIPSKPFPENGPPLPQTNNEGKDEL